MGELVIAALISGGLAAATAGGVAIASHQDANQANEEAKKAAKVQEDNQNKLLSDERNKKLQLRQGEDTAAKLAAQRQKQGLAAIGSRYGGGDGTATLLGGAGAPTSQGGKTMLGL